MKYLLAVASISLIAFTACDRRNEPGRVDLYDNNSSASKDGTVTEEHVEAPGEISKTEREKGSATVESQKKIVTTETETERESIPTIGTTTHAADINRMNEEDFVALGLNDRLADKIVDYREKNGDFKSVDDLRKVPGINVSWFNSMRSKLGASSDKRDDRENQANRDKS